MKSQTVLLRYTCTDHSSYYSVEAAAASPKQTAVKSLCCTSSLCCCTDGETVAQKVVHNFCSCRQHSYILQCIQCGLFYRKSLININI